MLLVPSSRLCNAGLVWRFQLRRSITAGVLVLVNVLSKKNQWTDFNEHDGGRINS